MVAESPSVMHQAGTVSWPRHVEQCEPRAVEHHCPCTQRACLQGLQPTASSHGTAACAELSTANEHCVNVILLLASVSKLELTSLAQLVLRGNCMRSQHPLACGDGVPVCRSERSAATRPLAGSGAWADVFSRWLLHIEEVLDLWCHRCMLQYQSIPYVPRSADCLTSDCCRLMKL
jgi:hypothetical protein